VYRWDEVRTASRRAVAGNGRHRYQGARWSPDLVLLIGIVAFVLAYAAYLVVKYVVRQAGDDPVDLGVYWRAGQVVRHVAPYYNPHVGSPIYDWPSAPFFTYPPFAALLFTVFSLFPLSVVAAVWIQVGLVALVVALWVAFGALGFRTEARLGAALLFSAAVLWTEPVLATLSKGQVELVLMALVLWDMCQPDQRRWKGIGVGIAAGIKLVPLIFIPYLLLTRRFRAAVVAGGVFAVTVVLAYLVLPADSARFWWDGLFLQSNRAGPIAEVSNQSITGLVTRLAGSEAAGHVPSLLLSAVIAVAGLAMALIFHRAGHALVAVLTCALTGLLVSPVSWDPHWVWIAPAVAVLAVYGIRADDRARRVYLVACAATLAVFAGYPSPILRHLSAALMHLKVDASGYFGLIFAVPNSYTSPSANLIFFRRGDQSSFAEYHWHGLELVFGNSYVLAGIGLFAFLAVTAFAIARRPAGNRSSVAARFARQPVALTRDR
jgi:alpha-1,2-mannosyltransferase